MMSALFSSNDHLGLEASGGKRHSNSTAMELKERDNFGSLMYHMNLGEKSIRHRISYLPCELPSFGRGLLWGWDS